MVRVWWWLFWGVPVRRVYFPGGEVVRNSLVPFSIPLHFLVYLATTIRAIITIDRVTGVEQSRCICLHGIQTFPPGHIPPDIVGNSAVSFLAQ